MPNRILKESLLRSRKVALLTAEEERLFTRLILTVDDYGRFYADPAIVKAACLPNIADTITNDRARAWLDRLDEVGLISRYVVDGEVYLELRGATDINKPRAKWSKFAPPEKGQQFHMLASESICDHPQASASIREHLRPITSTSTPTSTPTNTGAEVPEGISSEDDLSDDEELAQQKDLLGQPVETPLEAKVTEVLKAWVKVTAQKRPIITGKGSEAKRSIIRARLGENGGDADELIRALGGWLKDDYYVSGGYSGVDNIYRSRDRVEKFLAREGAPTRPSGAIAPGGNSGRPVTYFKPDPVPEWTPEMEIEACKAFSRGNKVRKFTVPKGRTLPEGFDPSVIPERHLPIEYADFEVQP